jgi:glycosyltransferase involved in cell wall biosynthesis
MLVGSLDPNPTSITQAEINRWVEEDIVEYHPFVKDIRPFLEQCSVFVLPSYAEGIPRSTLEAMALGRPIITTDAPGCRETVIDGRNGFLVPVRNSVALAKAMESFVLHSELVVTMGRESRRIIERRFNVNVINANLVRILQLDR